MSFSNPARLASLLPLAAAAAALRDGRPEEAFSLCGRVLAAEPDNADALNLAGGVEAFLAEFDKATAKGPLIPTLNIIAMAAAYARENATAIEMPFTLPTGELQPEVWARWLQFDPVRLVASHAEALKGLKRLYIDVGERDEYALHHGARILARRLEKLGVPFTFEEHPGGHFAINHRYKVSLKAVATVLAESDTGR